MYVSVRDRQIYDLRRRGLTLRQIAKRVGMTANGVHQVLLRLEAGDEWNKRD